MSRSRNRSFSDMITGIFMLTVLGLLGYFTIVISGVDIISGKERVKAVIAFKEVGGLKDHDAVMYRGTKVGTVERIELVEDGLKVHVEIDKSVRLRKSYCATVCALTMLGGNYLLLDEGEGEVVDYLQTELKGEPPIDWMRDVSKIAKNLKEFSSSKELRESMENIRSITAKANAVMTRVEAGQGTAGKLLSDEQIYNDIKATVADARASFAHANAVAARLDDAKLAEELKASVAALNELADRARRGEGTVGKLMKEDGMYNEVEGLIFDVRQILDNYRDTTPIATFSTLATGAL